MFQFTIKIIFRNCFNCEMGKPVYFYVADIKNFYVMQNLIQNDLTLGFLSKTIFPTEQLLNLRVYTQSLRIFSFINSYQYNMS